MKINKQRHRQSYIRSFIRCSERGVVEAIFYEFHNFRKIIRYLHGHNYMGLVLTMQKHIIYKYFIYLISIAIT